MAWIDEAVESGARRERACETLEIAMRTIQRWKQNGEVKADQRPVAKRPEPKNKLSEAERAHLITVSNRSEYASLPPSQIVPRLADKGEYLASESSFYRVLKEADQLHHRGRSKEASRSKGPATHIAAKANEVWTWDISYLPAQARGLFHYLYLVVDIYSRKIVGWEVHESEAGELAAELIQRCVMAEHCFRGPLVLHSDNGSPMKSYLFQAKLADLGITPSHSRPRVSNDNAFSEALFRTLKYCPQWPSEGFATLEEARAWISDFVDWYNNEHCHSSIKFVTPEQRHRGEDKVILEKRHRVYQLAKANCPERWSGETRNWVPEGKVTLNPEKVEQKEAA